MILVDCSDGWLDVPYEVLKRYKHDRCGGYEWDEQWLVTCKCGSDLFVALSDADPVEAAAERAFLAVEWAREVPW